MKDEGDITLRARRGVGLDRRAPGAVGADERWLTVVSPEDPDGTGVLLAPLNDVAKALQAHRCATGTPAVSFTDDDDQRYRDVRDRGVVVVSEPEAVGYGGTAAVYGGSNALNPDQHVPARVGG